MDLELPAKFGRYYLVDRIAVGGMAQVFAALVLGQGGFEKRAAVKRIHPHLLKPEYIELFTKEARISAKLQHANLVEVFDFGQVDDDWFIAMQWVDGITLEGMLHRLVRGRRTLDVTFAVHIALEVAAGLHYMHTFVGSGHDAEVIVHRDISPSNVLMGFTGVVKLADFGVATMNAEQERDRVRGKINYMSPELLAGESATPFSDQYALGVVLYEMLTMRRLFQRTSDLDRISLYSTEDVPPPSTMNPEVPRGLDQVVMKSLSHQPEDRFDSCEEMREALLEHASVSASGGLGRLIDGLFYRERARRRGRFQQSSEQAKVEAANQNPPAKPRPTSVVPDLPELSPEQTGTILVVDDVADNRDMLSRILKSGGNDVISAASGPEALQVLDNFAVDCVLLDVNMPHMSGFEVLEQVRQDNSPVALPVIMVTARADSEDVVHGLRLGANDYVPKPIDFDVLEQRVRTQIWSRRAFEAMHRSNEFYKAIVSNATEVVLQMSRACTLVYVSPSSWRILGRSPEQLRDTDFLELVPPEHRSHVAQKIEALGIDEPTIRLRHKLRIAGGIVVDAITTLTPAKDPDGTWVGFRGSVRLDD